MKPLSDAITEILDRIVAILANGAPVPAELLHALELRWQEERPDDDRGLHVLLKGLQVQPDVVILEATKSRADRFLADSLAKTGEWRRVDAKSLGATAFAGEKEQGWLYPVFFGTNRAPGDPQRPENGFGTRRAREVTYGRCNVWIPATHRFGETGEPWWRRWMRLQFADDHLARASACSPGPVRFLEGVAGGNGEVR